jgi:hypothetical protein
MSSERQPWFKWYPESWRGDDNVKGCSLAARGLWRECLDIMHNAPQRGYLVGQNGPLTDVDLAHFVGRPLREVRTALAEIEQHRVSSRTNDGILFSRRMVRDTARLEKAKADGRNGGNPTLKGEVKGRVNGTHIPARAQTRVLVSSDLDLNSTKEVKLTDARFETFWDAYPNKANKKGAAKVFARLKPDHELLTDILDAIKAQAQTRQWREGFVPHAQTWLNGERWKDEVPEAPAPKPAVSEWRPPRIPTIRELEAAGKI